MEKSLGITELREVLGNVFDEVQYQDASFIVERRGKPAGVIVPVQVYEKWKQNRERLFELIETAQANSGDNDPDEIMDLVLDAQQSVRGAMTEQAENPA